MSYLGIDLSPNHSAFVELDTAGKMSWMHYVTDKPTHAEAGRKPPFNGVRLKLDKDKDKSAFQMARLVWWKTHLRVIMMERKFTHVGIEDYAISMTGNNAYQIGELGGQARLTAIGCGALLRLIDPMSVKMYVAHHGGSTPEEVLEAVWERWPETHCWRQLPTAVQLDFAPAYGIARMIFDEVELRAGRKQLSDFHEKEIQVWNRITKTYPCNLLSRDWIKQ